MRHTVYERYDWADHHVVSTNSEKDIACDAYSISTLEIPSSSATTLTT